MAVNQPIRDVSFAGATINISGPTGSATITDFMDDANPVEFPDVEVSGVGVNLNGNMIRYAKPNVIMMSVTVIPFSDSDNALRSMWKAYRVQGGVNNGDIWKSPITATINCAHGDISLTNGTFVSGPGGPSSTGEGKMQGRTYTFAFVSTTR